jgi:hypothetical protein
MEIVTQLPEQFMREFEAEFQASVPAEKVKATMQQAFIGRALIKEGATAVEGLGQKLGEVDARTYFRWQQALPGCWQDKTFVHEFFRDNEQCRAKGWTPKASPLRHGPISVKA